MNTVGENEEVTIKERKANRSETVSGWSNSDQ